MVLIDGALLYQTDATSLKNLSNSSFLIIYDKQVENLQNNNKPTPSK